MHNATGRLCSGGEVSGGSREAGEAGGAQAAFVRFWVAGRTDSWSVLAFGAKWTISGRQRVRCGRPACITNAYLSHSLQLVHRLEDYRGARIINLYILMHRCAWHAHTLRHAFTWAQTAGETVRTARSARDHTGTRAGSDGRRWPNGLRLLPGRPTAPGNRVARGGTQGGLNCLTHVLPRCLPTPTEEADGGGGNG